MKLKQNNTERINESKSQFFENTNKINRSLAQISKISKEMTKTNRGRKEQGNITTDNKEIQDLKRD